MFEGTRKLERGLITKLHDQRLLTLPYSHECYIMNSKQNCNHPAISYSRVMEGCYLEENGLGKKEEARQRFVEAPFIRIRVAAYIAPG